MVRVDETPSYSFARKLITLKEYLKKWNAKEFGVEVQKNLLWSELNALDILVENRQLTIVEKDQGLFFKQR